MMTPSWQHFPHGADIGIRGIGSSVGEAFEQAAVALCAVVTEPELVAGQRATEIRASAPDLELLFVDWINALIFQEAVQHRLFSRFEVHIDGNQLQAVAWGEAVDRQRHRPAVEVKGATYTELRVGELAEGIWVAQCVVDV